MARLIWSFKNILLYTLEWEIRKFIFCRTNTRLPQSEMKAQPAFHVMWTSNRFFSGCLMIRAVNASSSCSCITFSCPRVENSINSCYMSTFNEICVSSDHNCIKYFAQWNLFWCRNYIVDVKMQMCNGSCNYDDHFKFKIEFLS